MQQVIEVFWQFLKLGFTSFGGPIVHFAIFHRHFVERLAWLDSTTYGHWLALSQVLPGPASSQMGFLIGLNRAGFWGAWAAFIGFTLPSFLLMVLFALLMDVFETHTFQAMLQGLKWLIVAIVMDALMSMFKSFCRTRLTQVMAFISALLMLMLPSIYMQFLILLLAATMGLLWTFWETKLFGKPNLQLSQPPMNGFRILITNRSILLFVGLLVGLPFFAWILHDHSWLELLAVFYQAGSWVFGGGHVVLPLLDELLGQVYQGDSAMSETLLLGYAAAQAMPGPMFSVAAFLGAELWQDMPWFGAVLATLMIFLPGFLLVLAIAPVWRLWQQNTQVAMVLSGVNAAVVGLLLAAWFNPILSGVQWDLFAFIGIGLAGLLVYFKALPIVVLVLGYAACGIWLYGG